ncbi:MAG TPA: GAF domain-containing protein, partial [Trichocoleus sp.]
MTDRLQNHSGHSGSGLSQDSPQNSSRNRSRNRTRAITEADVLITEALDERPTREPDLAAENQALHRLAQKLMGEPQSMLKTLVRITRNLCQAGTAGVSFLETSADGTSVFRWVAIAGALESLEQATMPGDFSLCNTALHSGKPQLYARPERYFTYLRHLQFPIVEALLFPLRVNEQQVGALVVLSHREERQFDCEDQRLMTSLAEFTAAALQSMYQRRAAEALLQREQEVRVSLRENEKRWSAIFSQAAAGLSEISLEG